VAAEILCAVGGETESAAAENMTLETGNPAAFLGPADTDGRGSQACYQIPGTALTRYSWPLSATGRTRLTVDVSFWLQNIAFSGSLRVGLATTSGQPMSIGINNLGFLQVFRGGTLLATGSIPLAITTWTRMRIEYLVASSGGYVRAYLNGSSTAAVDFTGDTLTSFNNPVSRLFIERGNLNNNVHRFDDVLVFDSTSGTLPSFLVIGRRAVTANGLRQEQSSGTFADVDEIPPVMTDAVQFSAPDQRFTVRTDAAQSAASYHGLLVQTRQQRSGSGAGTNGRAMFVTSGTDTYGATVNAPVDGAIHHVFQLDGSGNPWTKATLDAVLTADGVGYQTRT
jgi:hypothetical protein